MSNRVLALNAWLIALACFALACVLASSNDKFPGDVWLAQRIQDTDIPGFGRTLDWAEDSADLPAVVIICTVMVALSLLVRDLTFAVILPLIVSARVLITWALKNLIERPRPSAEFLEFESQPSTFAFPSGHATAAFVLYGLIYYFAAVHVREQWIRLPVQAGCVAIIVLTGLERVYVGHHWPSDIIGGYLLGALIVVAYIALHKLATVRASNRRAGRSFSRSAAATDPE
jgi:membrane-associated phospholipid phosphatase